MQIPSFANIVNLIRTFTPELLVKYDSYLYHVKFDKF